MNCIERLTMLLILIWNRESERSLPCGLNARRSCVQVHNQKILALDFPLVWENYISQFRSHQTKTIWLRKPNSAENFFSPFDGCSQNPNAALAGRHWWVTGNGRHTQLHSGRTFFTDSNPGKHQKQSETHTLHWFIMNESTGVASGIWF